MTQPSPKNNNATVGCIGLFLFVCLVGWIMNIAGCNEKNDNAFSHGYNAGRSVGKAHGYSSRNPPSASALNDAASRALTESAFGNEVPELREAWTRGYKDGFEAGFTEVTKPAF